MKAFGFYKSKKYFQRVLFSIALAMALALTGLSVANTFILERSVKSAQEDSNLKVLTQIQYNLSYMNEIVTHLSAVAFRDNVLVPMLFSDPLPAMDYIRGYNEMSKLVESASFLHSLAVYNAATDELYGSSSAFLVDDGVTKDRIRHWLLQSPQAIPTSRLIPVRLGADGGPIDAFAFLVTDTFKPFAGKESALVLYIKSDWVFDSLRRMNGAGSGVPGEVYIRTSDGRLYGGDASAPSASAADDGRRPAEAAVTRLLERDRAQTGDTPADGEAPESGFVIGDVGTGKSALTYMDAGDWTILYVQPYDALMKEVTAARMRSLLVTGVFLLLALGASVWLSYKLYDPIETMLRRIRPHLQREPEAGAAAGNELDVVGDGVLRLSETLQAISAEQIVRKYYLRKFLTDSGLFAEADMRQLVLKHGLRLSPDAPLTVCVLRIDRFGAYDRSTSAATKKLHGFAIVNIAQETVSASFLCEAVDLQADHAVLIVSGADGAESAGRLRQLIGNVQATVERYYGLSLSCGIGGAVSRLPLLSSAYRQAYQLVLRMFAAGYRSIVAPGDAKTGASGSLPPDLERRLAEALKKGQLASAGAELERAFSLLADFAYDDMRRTVSDLAWAIHNAAADIRSHRLVTLSVDTDRMLRTAEDNETLEDMYMSFLAVCAQICEGQRPVPGAERNEWLIGTVKELIGQKFMDPNLSQQSIASSVKLTSAYVGKLFKDRCGMTVTEYINDVRLEHARRLLLQTDDTIADIMERCGYSNQSYFFRLFKGKFGSTPKEFRLKSAIT